MRDVSKIFELLCSGANNSEISRKLGISRSTVRDYKIRADSQNLCYVKLSKLSIEELRSKFELKSKGRKPNNALKIDLASISKELLKRGVTKQLLYQEYYAKEPSKAVGYSAFCTRIREYQKSSKLSMKQEYKAGEKYFVDFSGMRFQLYSKASQPLFAAEIFVATLGLSNYTYVEAVATQNTEAFIGASARSLSFLGGSPECLVPDNLKAAVTRVDGYSADINKTYQELANYYQIAVLPARVRKPQDKAKVETAVRLIQQQILAPLRNSRFDSLGALNQAIAPLLKQFNERVMKSYGCSRRELFETIEKPELSPLPATPFDLCVWKKAKVHSDYHVAIEQCYYSVPFAYRGKQVDVCIKEKVIEIYKDSAQIALHKRVKQLDRNPKYKLKHRYSTKDEHMPASHKFLTDWTRVRILKFGKDVGSEMEKFIEGFFASYTYEPQAIRSSMTLPRLKDKCGTELLEMAAAIANRKQIYSMKYLKETLKLLSDKTQKPTRGVEPIADHENVRGEQYYH